MEQTVIKIGNSKGIVIPQKILNTSRIQLGDTIMVVAEDKKIVLKPLKKETGGVDAKFMKMVDEFIEDHKDVLQALSNR